MFLTGFSTVQGTSRIREPSERVSSNADRSPTRAQRSVLQKSTRFASLASKTHPQARAHAKPTVSARTIHIQKSSRIKMRCQNPQPETQQSHIHQTMARKIQQGQVSQLSCRAVHGHPRTAMNQESKNGEPSSRSPVVCRNTLL